jgi:ribosome-associated translation inhibitor RaiA
MKINSIVDNGTKYSKNLNNDRCNESRSNELDLIDRIHINSKLVPINKHLKNYISDELLNHIIDIFPKFIDIRVTINKQSQQLIETDINVNTGIKRVPIVRASGIAQNIYHASEIAIKKMINNLRNYHRKICAQSKTKNAINGIENASFENLKENSLINDVTNSYLSDDGYSEEFIYIPTSSINNDFVNNNNSLDDEDTINIQKARIKLNVMSVDDAVNNIELTDQQFFLFIDKETNCISIIFYKDDKMVLATLDSKNK